MNNNDLPLASKETMTLDSHRPLTYDTQNMKGQTNYNIRTPNLDDFLTKDSARGDPIINQEDEREDRIRTIQVPSDDEDLHGCYLHGFVK